ncbi:hypothetical protein QFC19_006768 [Naganishia cerealis]|uniref:Uncharacterized protein n=1 Tax=Naganishia cerealis TaxID=610337 RepID=A0ACC2VFX5_9TREE|nr:hypothetical protein QFC19_006768 [Naganishia cerealis]
MDPRRFKKEGLKHLDRVIELCAQEGIYTIIDLHAAAGGQNVDWHSDTGIHKALFWEHRDFQERTILLWEWLAEHYRGNPWVAGYNPLNEPTDSHGGKRLVAFYQEVEKRIRAVDGKHVLFLEYGFPNPPEEYKGTVEQKDKLKKSYERKIQYMREINGPIWNGEFGPVYASSDAPDAERINASRYQALSDQLTMYDDPRAKASWSIWLWKDIGFQGMVFVDKETAYMKLMEPFLKKKRVSDSYGSLVEDTTEPTDRSWCGQQELVVDAWGVDETPVRDLFQPLIDWTNHAVPSLKNKYPSTWNEKRYLRRVVREILIAEALCDEYAEYFRDKSMDELDALAMSFHYDKCVQRTELNDILTAHRGD